MSNLLQQSVGPSMLGTKVAYPQSYNPFLLQAISRNKQREAMGFSPDINFKGFDEWNCFELLWLDAHGKPMRACARILIPAHSSYLPESKSVKLYLHSLNNIKFNNTQELINIINKDLSLVCEADINIAINSPSFDNILYNPPEDYFCLDGLAVSINEYNYNKNLLRIDHSRISADKIYTHSFKSHCLCTGQPDWGSVFIDYKGEALCREALLAYLISFHNHQGFSENCIEQIFVDILTLSKPQALSVFGRFTRRGGIEINPYRSTHDLEEKTWRLSNQ
jgi:7-cyano-7-deazaguanine reductase